MTNRLVAVGYQEDWWPILMSPFMRDALLGGTIVALAAGLIGYFVVIRNTAFAERDVATGTVLAMATGLALFFNSLATRTSGTMTNVLFGNLLAISHDQLVTFAGLLVLLAVSIGLIYRPLLFTSINVQVAEAKGVPVRGLSIAFMALLGLAVTMAIQAVGSLLLFALVVTPAATAIILTARPGFAMLISTLISTVSVWLGLAVSAMFDLPPSFVIVAIACTAWFVVRVADNGVRPGASGSRRSATST